MRSVLLLSSVLAFVVAEVSAQRGGGGRDRPEEITNRVGVFFTDVKGPLPAGDKAGELTAVDMVRAGASAGQPTVLYLLDLGEDTGDVRNQFERTLFAADDLGILLRCFHCGRIDLKNEPLLAAKYGKQAPLFVVFDKDGKGGEVVSMAGYKASAKALETQLLKVSQGLVKPSMPAFVKEYGDVVRELENTLAKKKNAKERYARAGADKAKKAEVDRDLQLLEKDEEKLLEREKDVLGRITLPTRAEGAHRLGGRNWGGGGGGGGRGGNGGGGGGGNGGSGGRPGG
jgi:uncharacterized membrane protein YgcG